MMLQQCLAWSWIFFKMAWKSMEMAWNFILAQVYEPCYNFNVLKKDTDSFQLIMVRPHQVDV